MGNSGVSVSVEYVFSIMTRDDSGAGFGFVSNDGNVNELFVVVLSYGH
jgi:hypothetical protein